MDPETKATIARTRWLAIQAMEKAGGQATPGQVLRALAPLCKGKLTTGAKLRVPAAAVGKSGQDRVSARPAGRSRRDQAELLPRVASGGAVVNRRVGDREPTIERARADVGC